MVKAKIMSVLSDRPALCANNVACICSGLTNSFNALTVSVEKHAGR